MKTIFDDDQFCRETFDLPDASREQIIASMTRAHRRAQTARRLRNTSVLLAILLTATLLLLPKSPSPSVTQQTAKSEPNFLVHTAPFAGVIHTTPLSTLSVDSSANRSFAIVHTDPAAAPNITDDQLFELLKSRAVALVKSLSGARLEFLDQPSAEFKDRPNLELKN
jgi:hypothetical protein